MLEQFEKTGEEALAELQRVADLAALEEFRIKYLGRKGQVTQMLSQIGKFPAKQRRAAGQLANKVKKDVTGAFEQLKNSFLQSQRQAAELIDVTLQGGPVNVGKTHIITQTINELLEIFGQWALPLPMALKLRTSGIISRH